MYTSIKKDKAKVLVNFKIEGIPLQSKERKNQLKILLLAFSINS